MPNVTRTIPIKDSVQTASIKSKQSRQRNILVDRSNIEKNSALSVVSEHASNAE